jgi:alkylhydroperoxidase/carboxymuconolactone decarboxylase family protein YurZ
MTWAISARCEPCIKYYVLQAIKSGATEGEVGEFLAIASTMGGCVGEMWALKAFKAFKDQGAEAPSDQPPSCCV